MFEIGKDVLVKITDDCSINATITNVSLPDVNGLLHIDVIATIGGQSAANVAIIDIIETLITFA